jgi:hypothetical protein
VISRPLEYPRKFTNHIGIKACLFVCLVVRSVVIPTGIMKSKSAEELCLIDLEINIRRVKKLLQYVEIY